MATNSPAFDQSFYAQFPAQMSARLAAAYLDMNEQRLRALVHEGIIPATKDGVSYSFQKADLDEYRNTVQKAPKAGGTRENKAGKLYVIRVRFDQYQKVVEMLGAEGITLEPRYKAKKADNGAAEAEPAETETETA